MKTYVTLSIDEGEYFNNIRALMMDKNDVPLKGDILTLSELGESWEVVRREIITNKSEVSGTEVSSIRLIVVNTEYR